MAAPALRGANGIARSKDGLYFVANPGFGELYVLEEQDDHSLVLTDTVRTGMYPRQRQKLTLTYH